MIKEAMDRIIELKRPEMIDVNGKTYILPEYDPAREQIAAILKLNTLTGIVDYLGEDIDKSGEKDLFIHVRNQGSVTLNSALFGDFQQREIFLESSAPDIEFHFDRYMSVEEFIIALNAKFIPADDNDHLYITRIVSGLTEASSRELSDDGMSQKTVVKKGMSMVAEEKVKNPVTLKPYRTFLEIDQPASEFIFRLKEGRNGEPPQCALFESDGGAWKMEAIQLIKAWFKDKVTVSIIA